MVGNFTERKKQSRSFQSNRLSNVPSGRIWRRSSRKFLKSVLLVSLCGNPDKVASNISEGMPPQAKSEDTKAKTKSFLLQCPFMQDTTIRYDPGLQ